MMTKQLCGVLFALGLGACASSEGQPARGLPPEAPVAVSLPERPSSMFAGYVGIEVTTLPRFGEGEQAYITMQSSSSELSEGAGLRISVPLAALQQALSGAVVTLPPASPTLGNAGEYTGIQDSDPHTPEGIAVKSFSLGLDGATMSLTATLTGGGTVTALGQFGVICTQANSNGDPVTDGTWASEFCAATRDAIGLAPWIAAAR